MAYTQFLHDFDNIINSNVDYLFNYFDLDNLDLFINREKEPILQLLREWFTNIAYNYKSKLIYFYYPLFAAIKEFFIIFCSFNWLKDFSNISLFYNKTLGNILNEDIFIKTQFLESFDIFQLPIYIDNKLFIGFLNGLFLALPFSCNQIIYFYRFFVSGPTTSLIGIIGWLLGQCTLFICILFGLKPIIFQWFSLEPLNYFLNIYLIGSFIYCTIKKQPEPSTDPHEINKNDDDDDYKFTLNILEDTSQYRPAFTLDYESEEIIELDRPRRGYKYDEASFKSSNESQKQRSSKIRYYPNIKSNYPNVKQKYVNDLNNRLESRNLEKIFATHFLLSWTEANHIFAYLKDLNMGLEVNTFEITTNNFFNDYFLVHSTYIFGIFLGSLFFSLVYLNICFQILTSFFSIIIETKILKIGKLKRKTTIIKQESLEERTKRREAALEEDNNNEENNNHEHKISWITKCYNLVYNILSILFFELSKFIYEEKVEKTETKVKIRKTAAQLKLEEDKEIKENFPKIFRAINFNFLIILIALTLSSSTFYDIDYLLTNSLGFIPQDKELAEILLTSNSEDPNRESGFGSTKTFLEEDDNSFMLLEVNSLNDKEYRNILQFEDINYQAEYAWMSKLDRVGGNEVKTSTNKNRRLYPSQHDHPIVPYSNITSVNQNITNKENTMNKIIDNNYLQSSTRFQANKNSMDSNFKIDFIPFDDYLFLDKPDERLDRELETELKQKYYSNPIYKMLLHSDIDSFSSRQPSNFNLLELEENDIFQKRQALSNYYESNYYYTKLNYFNTFRKTFMNSKSYLNNIYNQQFAGTLKIVENLFPITLDGKNTRSVLKYDFPLLESSNINRFQHEELIEKNQQFNNNYKGMVNTSSSPLFLAWNDDLHQLVITNNLLLKKAVNFEDNYSYYSFNNDTFISGPMTLFNIQKLNNLSRSSYSIIKSPSLKKLFKSSYIPNNPNLVDLEYAIPEASDQAYLFSLSNFSRVDKMRNTSSLNINWYAFRYNSSKVQKYKTNSSKVQKDETNLPKVK
jgi:hypothetical protein